ncbi:hypothetical protein [Microlunatus speluncae]|uniref:hypothetical protein n=1 Tax=Microlunatus speluncae TaxID=2594267 RepID=UPI00126680B7|nr:hypothetical protein [Microlunatus speluncae]
MLVVTLIAAGVVAWQAYETRRSARASAAAAEAANEALGLARSEELHSRQLVAEAIRTRIDGQAPTITIVPNDQLRVVNDVERPIRFPQADDKPIFIAVGFTVINDSATTVVLRRRTVPAVEGAPEIDATVVAPGQRTFVAAEVPRSLAEWRAVADWTATGGGDEGEFRAAHAFERDARIVFSYVTAADDGVADEYGFRLVGSPLTPLGEEGAYDCFEADQVIGRAVQIVADPRRRTYYLSRSKGQELPSPESLRA